MIILFVVFMVFVFGGYHKNKFTKREKESQHSKDYDEKEKKS